MPTDSAHYQTYHAHQTGATARHVNCELNELRMLFKYSYLLMGEKENRWYEMESNDKVVMMMDKACKDETVARAVERMWRK